MDDTKQFAQDCAVFFKEKMFNADPKFLGRRMDAVVYIMAQNLLSTGPHMPTIEYLVMGTKGPGSPHLEELLHYLHGRNLPTEFYADMPS